jgi:hypothetical protein
MSEKKQILIEKIRHAYERGVDLNSSSIQRNKKYYPVYHSAQVIYKDKGRTFWEDALTDAGIDYSIFVKQQNWTKEKIKEILIRRHDEGKPINAHAITGESGLSKAIRTHFGSHDKALEYSGFDSAKIRKIVFHTEDDIMNVINERLQKNEDLRYSAMFADKELRKIVYAGAKKYGCWSNALRVAGIDYKKIAKQQIWTKEKIKKALVRRHDAGKPLNALAVREESSLYKAIRKHFDSYDQALKYCGFDSDNIIKSKPRTAEEIMDAIYKRLQKGEDVCRKAMSVNKGLRKIVFAGIRKYGDWGKTLQAAKNFKDSIENLVQFFPKMTPESRTICFCYIIENAPRKFNIPASYVKERIKSRFDEMYSLDNIPDDVLKVLKGAGKK